MNRAAQGRAAQRSGRGLEDRLDELHALYSTQGRAHILRTDATAIRARGGKIVMAAQVGADFRGVIKGGRFVALEAKVLTVNRLSWSRVPQCQRDDLDATLRLGGIALLYVELCGSDYLVPWEIARGSLGEPSIPVLAPIRERWMRGISPAPGVIPLCGGDWLAAIEAATAAGGT